LRRPPPPCWSIFRCVKCVVKKRKRNPRSLISQYLNAFFFRKRHEKERGKQKDTQNYVIEWHILGDHLWIGVAVFVFGLRWWDQTWSRRLGHCWQGSRRLCAAFADRGL
jgi:hypothetical protein